MFEVQVAGVSWDFQEMLCVLDQTISYYWSSCELVPVFLEAWVNFPLVLCGSVLLES
jgi:hypothetical protein